MNKYLSAILIKLRKNILIKMKNNIPKILFVFLYFSFQFYLEVYCQNFKTSPLIDIPGDNTEFDVLSSELGLPGSETYICWINKYDSTFTVYLKQISPILSDNIVVASDERIKSKPQIALNRYSKGIRIVWQYYNTDVWQVYIKNYFENQLSDSTLILDSINNDPKISLSNHRIAWIENGNLLIKEFYPELSDVIIVDSLNCNSPELVKYDYLESTQILYVKNYTDLSHVCLASYNESWTPKFRHNILSEGVISTNPKFGLNLDIAFQTFENDVWKAVYTESSYENLKKTNNSTCNYKNPILFTYPVPTSFKRNVTPFFLAFDTDSLSDNNEVFIKTFYYGMYNSLINISNSEGKDYEPRVTYLSSFDTVYISLIWNHTQNEKTDIWMAKDVFSPIITEVENRNENNCSFNLIQNYPNPFNPSTKIKYTIPSITPLLRGAGGMLKVQLKIYDIPGSEVATLVNEAKQPGTYEVEFNAVNLPSGVYFYRLHAGDFTSVKKMILLR